MNLQGQGWQAAAIAACAAAAGVAVTFTEAQELAVTLPTGTTVQFAEAVNYFAGKQEPAEDAATVSAIAEKACWHAWQTLLANKSILLQLAQHVGAALVIADDDSATVAMGDKASLLITLANMGVQSNAIQATARAAFTPSAALAAALSSIEAALTTTPFLAGAAPGVSDFVIAAALYRGVAVIGGATVLATAPTAQTWLNTVAVHHLSPAFEVVGASLGGWKRIGGQVDRRPSPFRTAAAADASIELNSSYKKKANQRQKERAAKKAELAASSTAGNAATGGAAPAPAAAAAAAATGPFGIQATANQRAENTQGVPSLQDGILRVTSALSEWGVAHTGPFEHEAAVDVRMLLPHAPSYHPPPPLSLLQHCSSLHASHRTMHRLPSCWRCLLASRAFRARTCLSRPRRPRGEQTTAAATAAFGRSGVCTHMPFVCRDGDSRMWLVVLRHDTTLNMKDLATQLGYGKITIRFGDAKSLLSNLGTAQGHVSPFALMNDTKLDVQVAIDEAIVQAGAEETFLLHPLMNEACVGVKGGDLGTVVQRTGHNFVTVKGE